MGPGLGLGPVPSTGMGSALTLGWEGCQAWQVGLALSVRTGTVLSTGVGNNKCPGSEMTQKK